LYKQFAVIVEKYISLQKVKSDKGPFQGYAIVIARSPAELMREGDILNHCVGKMGYDQKMVREESLIFFVRNTATPDVPFITVEYSLKSKKILQCYGYKHARPDDNVMTFINKTWLPYANKTLKKIAA
ncbi:MAG: PcfJ domain-containing protein, partial [Firmicutes bacterium]|nr:PcfJ domain-containing protein [Bacillota bacterium]